MIIRDDINGVVACDRTLDDGYVINSDRKAS